MGEKSGVAWEAVQQPAGFKSDVKMRPYQRQSLAFMLEQERLEGGINGRFWAPMATVDAREPHRRLFYSAALDKFSLESRLKGKMSARGGFLCDEMGLVSSRGGDALGGCSWLRGRIAGLPRAHTRTRTRTPHATLPVLPLLFLRYGQDNHLPGAHPCESGPRHGLESFQGAAHVCVPRQGHKRAQARQR